MCCWNANWVLILFLLFDTKVCRKLLVVCHVADQYTQLYVYFLLFSANCVGVYRKVFAGSFGAEIRGVLLFANRVTWQIIETKLWWFYIIMYLVIWIPV